MLGEVRIHVSLAVRKDQHDIRFVRAISILWCKDVFTHQKQATGGIRRPVEIGYLNNGGQVLVRCGVVIKVPCYNGIVTEVNEPDTVPIRSYSEQPDHGHQEIEEVLPVIRACVLDTSGRVHNEADITILNAL